MQTAPMPRNVIAVAAISIPLVLGASTIASAEIVPAVRAREHNSTRTNSHLMVIRIESKVGQAYFWTPEWQAHERAADAALRAGDYEDFDNAEDAVTWLFGEQV